MGRAKDPGQSSGVRIIEVEIRIRAPIERVWKALIEETGKWWPRDFYTSGEAKTFAIEPILGGKMYEDWGNGAGVVWATVTAVKAPTILELSGVSSPAWGGPSTHYHAFRLEERDGGTRLRFSDAIHGRIDDASEASLKDGWLLLFDQALRSHCEATNRDGPLT